MRTERFTIRTLAAFLLGAGLTGPLSAQVKVEDLLARKPVQANVAITTPTGADLTGCRVEQVNWPKQGDKPAPAGFVVKDSQGRTIRQFIDTTGGNRPNIWSFYLNGAEAYREVDGNGNGKPDQYRWLGANGGKWGADVDEDGQVDSWFVLSPEELSQEIFQALLTRDPKRLEAALISEQDLKSLGLPDADAAKIRQRAAGAVKRLQETAEALKLTDKSKWVHLELGLPHVTPADSFGGRADMVRQQTAAVLVDKGDGKTAEVFQLGELMLVGTVWKVVDGPSYGAAPAAPGGADVAGIDVPAAAQPFVDELAKLKPPASPAENAQYQTARAALLEKIVGVTQGPSQEPWIKQVIDAYAAVAETGAIDGPAMQRLKQWQGQIEKSAPKSNTAAYASFRLLTAEYTIRVSSAKADDVSKVQTWWREQLEAFVNAYPAAPDETPEALARLAIAQEYVKDGEAGAKAAYERLAKDFPNHAHGIKAQGAIKRMTSVGQPFVLTGQSLDGKPFSMAQLAGKPVVVYYWASWGNGVANEMKQLGEMVKAAEAKGLTLVTISLDDDPAKAVQALNAAQLPGTHLHMPGGMERSPLAIAYGIQMVPYTFIVNKDGKVSAHNIQVGPPMKDEIERVTK